MDTQTHLPVGQAGLQSTLIEELGLASLPPEKQEELLVKMTEVVLKRIFVTTMEKLSEADQEEYSKLIDANAAPEEVEKLLTEKIPDYGEMVKKVVEDFKGEMLKQ